ncbi:MAG: biosynthetic arginine decarboxylase [Elainellaceae cyanobacterium]
MDRVWDKSIDHSAADHSASGRQAHSPTRDNAGDHTPDLSAAGSSQWTIDDSERLYRIQEWGDPYFSINAAGHVTVSPQGDRGGTIDLYDLVQGLKARNLSLPLLIRFSNILEDRIERLNSCFAQAIARYGYAGRYQGVFPVKCNQQRHLVQDVVRFGKGYQFGLEAGSKPELMIALALLDTPGALLICNGYKDKEYIETAILARQLGYQSIIVLEQLDEVDTAIEQSRLLKISPVLGIRAKLSVTGEGRWQGTTGDRAKFGLTVPEMLTAVERLKAADMLDCLQLLHFHVGSQISSISVIKDALREACQIYVALAKLGADMQYLDVGGGLGVDYDGSKTNFHASKNYTMQNYASDVVAEVKEACDAGNVTPPTLVSESGRAIASHQSVLVFDVLGVSQSPEPTAVTVDGASHLILRNLRETYQSISAETYQEAYHDAIQFKQEALSLFNFGYLSLTERAAAERLYWACCQKVRDIACQQDEVPEDLAALEVLMSSVYYVNLSIFQSVPDSWAIGQLFPIMPIHRLTEAPTCRGILADLTCDSDGKIDQFIERRNTKSVLELHPLERATSAGETEVPNRPLKHQPYYLSLFLGGAYQEIMGSFHNLFGSVNTVHVTLTPGGYGLTHLVKGDATSDVLAHVEYSADDLLENIRLRTEVALHEGTITLEDASKLLENYAQSLGRYTYLNAEPVGLRL